MKAIFWLSVFSSCLQSSAEVIACPERLGGQQQACIGCGGNPGSRMVRRDQAFCRNKAADGSNCLCDAAATTVAPVRTSVVSTGTATGTYTLATLTAYAGLKQKITTSITLTPTAADKPAATVAAIVFAGGVAWYLGTLVGEEAVLNPPLQPEGHPDDSGCQELKPKCKDCAAVLGFCVVPNGGCICDDSKTCPSQKSQCSASICGGNAGKCTVGDLKDCDCDSPKCPAGDQKPKCDDAKCKGVNGKCTAENKECECDATVACPLPEDALFCATCGGEENDIAKCKAGGPCCKGGADKDKFRACACYQTNNFGQEGYQQPIDAKDVGTWFEKIERAETAVCQTQDPNFSETKARKRPQGAQPNIESAAQDWCGKVDGKSVEKGLVEYQHNIDGLAAFWLSASYRANPPSDLKCSGTAKILKDDCIKSITSAVTDCEPKQEFTHGASLAHGCISFNITVNGETRPDKVPWAAETGWKGQGICSRGNGTEVDSKFFKGLWPQFCAEVKEGQSLHKVYKNVDFKPPGSKKRAPPASSKQYDDYKFSLEYQAAPGTCQQSCKQAFEEMQLSCGNGGIGNTKMMHIGNFDASCGKYIYEIMPPEPGRPIGEVKCYPTHDSDPEFHQLIRLCNLNPQEICTLPMGPFCQSKPGPEPTQWLPIWSNHYDWDFVLADGAPADCANIKKGNRAGSMPNANVDLCAPAYAAIIEACPWNGGEVRNICGTFRLQSCPLGGVCAWGNPGHHG